MARWWRTVPASRFAASPTLAGVIDPGYRGEIKVVMTNLNPHAVEIQPGDRIAQLRIVQRIEAVFEEVAALVDAPRGAAGFGSTGVVSGLLSQNPRHRIVSA